MTRRALSYGPKYDISLLQGLAYQIGILQNCRKVQIEAEIIPQTGYSPFKCDNKTPFSESGLKRFLLQARLELATPALLIKH